MDRAALHNSTLTVKVEGKVKLSAREMKHILERIEELAPRSPLRSRRRKS